MWKQTVVCVRVAVVVALLATNNLHAQWTKLETGITSELAGVYFHNENEGWVSAEPANKFWTKLFTNLVYDLEC